MCLVDAWKAAVLSSDRLLSIVRVTEEYRQLKVSVYSIEVSMLQNDSCGCIENTGERACDDANCISSTLVSSTGSLAHERSTSTRKKFEYERRQCSMKLL